jgi:hypothetical protein
MQYSRTVVPSTIQDSTSPNKESANELANVAFMSKGELLRFIQIIHSENKKIKDENRKIRDKLLALQKAEIDSLRGRDVFMKVAV